MNVFTFSSNSLYNVQVAVGFNQWAQPMPRHYFVNSRKATMVKEYVRIGDLGIFYLSNSKPEKRYMTVPFIIRSIPKNTIEVSAPWPGKWMFPFEIEPWGRTNMTLPIKELLAKFPAKKINYASSSLFSFYPNNSFDADVVRFILDKISFLPTDEKKKIVDKISAMKPSPNPLETAQWWQSL